LWLSILKIAASPSPMSITPAFSPGPQITHGASVGSFFKMDARAFVAAMLRPHDRKDAELEQIRFAPERFQDAGIFVGREAMLGDDLRSMRGASRTSMRGPLAGEPSGARLRSALWERLTERQ